jgi:hypothetical protein
VEINAGDQGHLRSPGPASAWPSDLKHRRGLRGASNSSCFLAVLTAALVLTSMIASTLSKPLDEVGETLGHSYLTPEAGQDNCSGPPIFECRLQRAPAVWANAF